MEKGKYALQPSSLISCISFAPSKARLISEKSELVRCSQCIFIIQSALSIARGCIVAPIYGTEITIFHSFVHFVSLYLHYLSYLCLHLPSTSPSTLKSPSSSLSLFSSVSQKTKTMRKGEAQRIFAAFFPIIQKSSIHFSLLGANVNKLKLKTTGKL